MHGIMLKRLGHNVHILEQNASSARSGYAAGISAGPHVQEFLKNHDFTKLPYSVDAEGIQLLEKTSKVKRFIKKPYRLTSWTLLYYRLRANFDGLRSDFCSDPPPASESDGKAIFDTGKRVIDVELTDGTVKLRYEDVNRDKDGMLYADFVIGADGANSFIRRKVLPNVQRPYAGYVAFRGTVPQRDVSEETNRIFDGRLSLCNMSKPKNYILLYNIPGEESGSVKPGERVLNYIWYYNVAESSQDFTDIMTDTDGHVHHSMVPTGKLRKEVWDRQTGIGKSVLPKHFVELLEKTKQPFVSAVSDSIVPAASFFDGKLILVGDALSLFRPHVALSTNQGALHCSLLAKVLKGEMSMMQWERKALQYASSTRLSSIVVGNYGQKGLVSFFVSIIKYFLVIIGQKIPGLWPSKL